MDSTTATPDGGVDISTNVDGLFWGTIVAIGLLGVTTVQSWTYATQNSDRWWIRVLVIILILLDFVTGILGVLFVYYDLVLHFGSVSTLRKYPGFVPAAFALTIVMVFIVQVFFASRVHLLNPRSHLLPGVIAGSAIASLACGLSIVFRGFENMVLVSHEVPNKITGGLMAGFSVIVDVLTTLSLSWTFNSASSMIPRSKKLLDKLLFYAVTRGLFLAVMQIVALGLTVTARLRNTNWAPSYLVMSKLYVITMVSMLNSRDSHSQNIVDLSAKSALSKVDPEQKDDKGGGHSGSNSRV